MTFKEQSPQRPPDQVPGTTPKKPDGMEGVVGHANQFREGQEGDGGGRAGTTKSRAKPRRAMASLGRGRSVIVIGHDLTLDRWIKTVQEALSKARRAKSYGLELDSFLKMLADVARQ